MSPVRALVLRVVRIAVFAAFFFGIGWAATSGEWLVAGALLVGLFAFYGLWIRAGAEACAAEPPRRPGPP